jgi:hypothetical protein
MKLKTLDLRKNSSINLFIISLVQTFSLFTLLTNITVGGVAF